MKTLVISLLLSATVLWSDEPPNRGQSIPVLYYAKKLPTLSLIDVSLEEALKSIERSWLADNPKEPFKVSIADFYPDGIPRYTRESKITLILDNCSYGEAFELLATASQTKFRWFRNAATYTLDPMFISGGTTRGFIVNEGQLKALGLRNDSDAVAVAIRLKPYGIDFAEGFSGAVVNGSVNPFLLVTNTTENLEKIAGLLNLIKLGYSISREAEPGAAQPATQPADKPPLKNQPSPPTSKVSPR